MPKDAHSKAAEHHDNVVPGTLLCMTDPIEQVLAPAAIKRALSIFQAFKDRDHATIVQAPKALTEHIFGLVASGQLDEHKLVVSGLTHLKSLEANAEAAKP
jgi:hypothetical protein